MGAGHSHTPAEASDGASASRMIPRMIVAAGILATFFVVELTTSLLINSIALLADAGHMLTDVVAVFMGLAAVMLAKRGSSSPARTYGWHRAEVFTAVANAALLVGVALFILYEAIERLKEAPAVPGVPMIVVALAGLAANFAVALLLRSHSEDSLAVKGAYMEVVADTVGSIGVLIAGIVTVTTHWPYADVVVAILVALWVLPRAISLARAALRILSESSPAHIDVEELRIGAGRRRRRDRGARPARVDSVARQGHVHRASEERRRLGPGAERRARGAARARAGPRHRPDRVPGRHRALRADLLEAERFAGLGVAIVEQVQAAPELVGLADGVGGPCQSPHAPQEAPVGFVRIRDRTKTLPAVTAQLVQPPVVAGARVGVGGDGLVVGQRLLGERRPGHRRRRVRGGDDGRVLVGRQLGLGFGVTGQQNRIRS